MIITQEMLDSIAPKAKNKEMLLEMFNIYLPKFYINTPDRIAMFLAQVSHESAGMSTLVENLNYSARSLRNTWPSRFKTDAIAISYARNPRKIANKVYADRLGNGSEASGDGWAYRGRGLIQLTGLSNYKAFEDDTGIPCVSMPDILTNIPEAVISACWYWNKGNPTGKSLNAYADSGDIINCTKKINGGLIGIEHRTEMYHKILTLIKEQGNESES